MTDGHLLRGGKPAVTRWRLGLTIVASLALSWVIAMEGSAAERVMGRAGRLDGTWSWRLPDTPNGLKPTQSWHATGSVPNGDIYVGGMDHATNAALYRLTHSDGALRYVGDARSASEAVHNWKPGETAEKFHTRPLWHRGKIYVATLDRSTLDDAYLSRRGFHWYGYDPARDSFTDLGASERGGTGAVHGGLVTLASDPVRNVIYGAAVPTGDIYRYDVASGLTEKLGRPSAYDRPYVYAGRVMWVDSRGRLYFTAGNPLTGTSAIYAHVYFYDPATHRFGERKDWALKEPRALEVGQCLPERAQCFFSDDQGHVYRFDDAGPSWSYLGQVETPTAKLWVWLFDVSADGRKAYLATSSWAKVANPSSLYEFDLATGRTLQLCSLADVDPELDRLNIHTGYDAWDDKGRFHFSSFSTELHRNVVVTRIDPVRLKVALGLLPALSEVRVERSTTTADGPSFVFGRTNGAGADQQVLYRLSLKKPEDARPARYGKVTIPEGALSLHVSLKDLSPDDPAAAQHGVLSVIPNGDDYTVGTERSVAF